MADEEYHNAKPTFLDNVFRTKPLKVIQAEEKNEELPRSLSLFDLICIGIGSTVGSGIFATTGVIISKTAGPAAVVSWFIGGFVCCLNAFAYMELTTRIPSSGSTYAYAYHAIGELPAVIGAWLVTLEYGVSGAGVARSWAEKIEKWLLEANANGNFHWLNLQYANILAAAVQALCVAILLMGIRFGKTFVNVVTVIKIAVVLFIIIAGFSAVTPSNYSPFIPERHINKADDPVMAFGIQGVITGASQAFFGYIGFDEVCCLAAEAKNPKTVMPRAVIGVVLGTMFLSAFSSLALAGMVSYESACEFADGFKAVHWNWAAQIVHAGECITMPVVVLISFLAQPRVNYALACDGLMPQIFAKVDDSGNLFVNTLITGIFFTAMAFLVPFTALWDLVSFGILLSLIMSNSALLMIRTKRDSPRLAPWLVFSAVVTAFATSYTFQLGYMNNDSIVCLVLAIVFFIGLIVTTTMLAIKCPQQPNDPANFSAPLVPWIPVLSILLDWYLIAQISFLGMGLGCAWIGGAIISYFVYGYGNSAGRTGWSALLNYLPRDDKLASPILSVNEVAPSMTSMLREPPHHEK
ncbi:TPA: hypothetical protein N0F65_008746 [Lagenidium giganteum]|uniref:Cationic amino acid transporter C-terminal domain-containing protein n=1 Tax=Lagenidium giganteum TaxID=4803 RepID=A0AAV2Z2H5_9STRA|nr:TPA: hypothetical protein N0F65_008746 [Lagenidium giganteum]